MTFPGSYRGAAGRVKGCRLLLKQRAHGHVLRTKTVAAYFFGTSQMFR